MNLLERQQAAKRSVSLKRLQINTGRKNKRFNNVLISLNLIHNETSEIIKKTKNRIIIYDTNQSSASSSQISYESVSISQSDSQEELLSTANKNYPELRDYYRIIERMKEKILEFDKRLSSIGNKPSNFEAQLINHKKSLYMFMEKSLNRLLMDLKMEKSRKKAEKSKNRALIGKRKQGLTERSQFQPAYQQYDITIDQLLTKKAQDQKLKNKNFFLKKIHKEINESQKVLNQVRSGIDLVYTNFHRKKKYRNLLQKQLQIDSERKRGTLANKLLISKNPLITEVLPDEKNQDDAQKTRRRTSSAVRAAELNTTKFIESIREEDMFLSKQFLKLCDKNIISKPIVDLSKAFAVDDESKIASKKERNRKWLLSQRYLSSDEDKKREMDRLMTATRFFFSYGIEEKLRNKEGLKRFLMGLNSEETDRELIKVGFLSRKVSKDPQLREGVNHIRSDRTLRDGVGKIERKENLKRRKNISVNFFYFLEGKRKFAVEKNS